MRRRKYEFLWRPWRNKPGPFQSETDNEWPRLQMYADWISSELDEKTEKRWEQTALVRSFKYWITWN